MLYWLVSRSCPARLLTGILIPAALFSGGSNHAQTLVHSAGSHALRAGAGAMWTRALGDPPLPMYRVCVQRARRDNHRSEVCRAAKPTCPSSQRTGLPCPAVGEARSSLQSQLSARATRTSLGADAWACGARASASGSNRGR